MRPTLSATLLLAALTPALPASSAGAPEEIAGFANPESVLVVGDRRFVSNIGAALDPTGKDGDGFISALAADGTLVALRAFPGEGGRLDAPKGMALAGGRLYVADIDRVVGFDLESRAQVFEARLPGSGPTLANDLAAIDDGRLLVTETLGGAVWVLDLADGRFTRLTDAVPGANGILYDPARKSALVVGLGADFGGGDVFRVGLDGAVARVPESPHGILDGIGRLPDGSVVVSDWITIDPPATGRLLRLAPDGAGPGEPFAAAPPVVGPADFAVDAAGDLWIPALQEDVVAVVPAE